MSKRLICGLTACLLLIAGCNSDKGNTETNSENAKPPAGFDSPRKKTSL